MTSAAPHLSKRHLARRTARRRSARTPQGHLSRGTISLPAGGYNPALSIGIIRMSTGVAMLGAERSLSLHPAAADMPRSPWHPRWLSGAPAAPRAGHHPRPAPANAAGSPVHCANAGPAHGHVPPEPAPRPAPAQPGAFTHSHVLPAWEGSGAILNGLCLNMTNLLQLVAFFVCLKRRGKVTSRLADLETIKSNTSPQLRSLLGFAILRISDQNDFIEEVHDAFTQYNYLVDCC